MRINWVCILLSTLLFAQGHDDHTGHDHGEHSESVFITGQILNILNGTPIEYASVSLMHYDDKEIEMGQLSDSDGRFIFRNMHAGDYMVEINFMGFEDWQSKLINISSSGNIQDLGIIELSFKALALDEVSIVDTKEIYEFETDKMIYNPDNDITASNGSAEDVLQNAPMVDVDQDGEVSLRGNTNVKILVDGRMNRLDLANISGSQIEKVEVITSPSAKYDPDGMAGIINIVLKKGTNEGFNGNIKINANHNKYHSVDEMNGINLYGNYRSEKINLFGSLGLNNKFKKRDAYRNVTNTYYNDNVESKADSLWYNSSTDTERDVSNIRFGLDYYLDESMVLTAELSYGKHQKFSKTIQEFTETINDEPISNKETNEEEGDSNFDANILIAFEKTFLNPDQELIFSINKDTAVDNEVETLLLNDSTYTSDFREDISNTEIDLSYKYPVNDKIKFEFGYGGLLNNLDKDMIFQLDGLGDNPITNNFNYKRNLHAVFFESEFIFSDNFSIKPSARYEQIQKDIIFDSDLLLEDVTDLSLVYDDLIIDARLDSPYKIDRKEFYPGLHFNYNFENKKSIQFGVSKRVNRPEGQGGHSSWQVMPFPRNIYNTDFVFVGNPFLKPEYSTQYDINFSSPIPMGFGFINLYYHDIKNKIEWYDNDQYPGANVLTFENAQQGSSRGIEFFMMIMGQTLGGGYSKDKISDDSGDYELNEDSESYSIFNKIKLPAKYIKLFDFEFGLYWMKIKVPTGSMFGDNGTTWANIGISRKFLNDRLTAAFTIDNLFDSGGFQMLRTKDIEYNLPSEYTSGIETTDVFSGRGGRTIRLTLKYQFGKKYDDKNRAGGHSHGGGEMDMGY
jgi:outer membrane receptor protein involved in Fe transport